jgi:transcriptional regulator with XRE-family HTH domain
MGEIDTNRYVEVLRDLMDRSGNSRAQVEQKLGWARGQLTKLLHGTYNLKVSQVLAILDMIGVEPLRYYTLVHGEPGSPPRLRGGDIAVRIIQSLPEPDAVLPLLTPPSLTADELEMRIEAAIERALARRDQRPVEPV